MLTIVVQACPDDEVYNETTNEFITVKGLRRPQTLQLEHSLISLSRWERKWHKSFIKNLDGGKLSLEETIDYIRCMTLNKVDPEAYNHLTNEHMVAINEYISDPMTAIKFNDNNKSNGVRDTITYELIYYWMIASNIPVEFEKWHLNSLISLIRVCSIKSQPEKKMSRNEILSRNRALNAARRKQLNTKG